MVKLKKSPFAGKKSSRRLTSSTIYILIAAAVLCPLFVLTLTRFSMNNRDPKDEQLKSFNLGQNQFGLRYANARESNQDYVRSQMQICYTGNNNACYTQVAGLLSAQYDYSSLLKTLESTQNYPEVFAHCHQLVHYVGRLAYETNPDIRKLYESGSPACWGGFYHGVIEAYFAARPYENDEKFVSEIRNVCGSSSDYSTPRFYYECLHGIGHAMMFVSVHDLPKSLKWCDSLATGQNQTACYGGVFMENSSSSTNTGSLHESKYVKTDDPLYPCNTLEEKYLPDCYQYQSSYFAQITKYDWVKTAELCQKVPKAYQEGCFRIIGSNQVGFTQDYKTMLNTCESMPTAESTTTCINGVVSGLTGRYVNEPEMTKQFCDIVASKFQEGCWTDFGNNLNSWANDKVTLLKHCETSNFEHTKWCKKGLGELIPEPVILN